MSLEVLLGTRNGMELILVLFQSQPLGVDMKLDELIG